MLHTSFICINMIQACAIFSCIPFKAFEYHLSMQGFYVQPFVWIEQQYFWTHLPNICLCWIFTELFCTHRFHKMKTFMWIKQQYFFFFFFFYFTLKKQPPWVEKVKCFYNWRLSWSIARLTISKLPYNWYFKSVLVVKIMLLQT